MKASSLVILIFFAGFSIGCSRKTGQEESVFKPLEFDIKQTSFSYPGSTFSVGNTVRTNGLVLTDIRNSRFARRNIIFRILTVSGGDTLVPEAIGTPGELSLLANDRVVGKACFESPDLFRLIGTDSTMILQSDSILIAEDRIEIEKITDNSYKISNRDEFGTSRTVLSCSGGMLHFIETRGMFILKPGKSKKFEISLEQTDSSWHTKGSELPFDQCVTANQESFGKWLTAMPSLPEKYTKARNLAAYVLWSCIIDTAGHHKRPAILMSKNWMHYIWSWDHCFNAMACSYGLPDFAWDNFMTIFDARDERGRLPDMIGFREFLMIM